MGTIKSNFDSLDSLSLYFTSRKDGILKISHSLPVRTLYLYYLFVLNLYSIQTFRQITKKDCRYIYFFKLTVVNA